MTVYNIDTGGVDQAMRKVPFTLGDLVPPIATPVKGGYYDVAAPSVTIDLFSDLRGNIGREVFEQVNAGTLPGGAPVWRDTAGVQSKCVHEDACGRRCGNHGWRSRFFLVVSSSGRLNPCSMESTQRFLESCTPQSRVWLLGISPDILEGYRPRNRSVPVFCQLHVRQRRMHHGLKESWITRCGKNLIDPPTEHDISGQKESQASGMPARLSFLVTERRCGRRRRSGC